MDDMARHGNGTYDHDKRQWKVRTQGLKASATIKQLVEMFRVEVPASERESRPFRLRYLGELRKLNTVSQAEAELAEAKIKYKDNDPPEYSNFERDGTGNIRRKQRLGIDTINLINAAAQISDPNGPPEVRDWLIGNLRAGTEPPKNESLRHEIDQYIDGYRRKGGKQWHEVRRSLDLLYEATGNIGFRSLDVTHYRQFLAILDREQNSEQWTSRTKQNRQRCAHTFLRYLEADHNVIFGFVRNSKYRIEVGPSPTQTKYTLEQVKTAVQHAKGIARTALLLGLNCGWYASDIKELKAAHLDGTYIVKARAKNKRNGVQKGFVGKWRLWPETLASLQYGLSTPQIERHYKALREKYDLPEHMALRKTVAQWIHDIAGEEVSKNLYRAEGYGTHYTSYVCTITPEQTAKLDTALETDHQRIFG